jgi:pimeloyl-ACP methyl ester carboxylesterase
MAFFVSAWYPYLRVVLPAIYYRLDRCSTEDVSAFKHFLDNVVPLLYPEEVPFAARQGSWALFYHLGLSELMSDNPMSYEEMKEIDKTLLASMHWSLKTLQLLEKGWPTYETDMYYRQWASQEVPILMLNGTLDPMIPIDVARIAKQNLTGPNQYLIEVPNATHGVTFNSPVENILAPDCGMQIVLDYMEDPLEKPDPPCLNNPAQINFRGNPLVAKLLFGVWDLWENDGNASLTNNQSSPTEEEVEEILHDLRQRPPGLR